MTTVGPALQAFLAQPLLAVVGTLRRNGAILLTPVWFEHRAGEVWLNSYASATWPRHLRRTGTATLLLVDPADPLRTAHLECALAEITSAGARAHIDALARRYLGEPYRGPHEDRISLRLTVRSLRSTVG